MGRTIAAALRQLITGGSSHADTASKLILHGEIT